MCFGKWKWDMCTESVVDVCLHGPCCLIFSVLGVVQVSTGLYYYASAPVFKLLFSAFVGFSSLVIGIVGLIILCVCLSNVRKYELILYCSTAVIFLNAINLVFLEFGQLREVFSESYRLRIKDTSYDLLPEENGRMVTSVTALLAVLIGFLESQFTFCCLNRVQYLVYEQRLVKKDVNPEASADLEYVIEKKKLVNIPRGSSYSIAETAGAAGDGKDGGLMGTLGRRRKSAGKSGTLTRQNKHQYLQERYQQEELAKELADQKKAAESTKIEVYTQSWVFKENGHSGQPGSFSSLSSNTSPELSPKTAQRNGNSHISSNNNNQLNSNRTHQRNTSEISQTPSGDQRQTVGMSSFSRNVTPIPSPVPHEYENRTFGGGARQSCNTINNPQTHSRSNSDYLAVATTPKHYENTMTLRSPNRLTASLHQQSSHYHQSTMVHQLPQPTKATIVGTTASSESPVRERRSRDSGSYESASDAAQKKRSTFSSARGDASYASLISELEESLSGKLNHNRNHQNQGHQSHQQNSSGHYHNVTGATGGGVMEASQAAQNTMGNPHSDASLSTDPLTAGSSPKSSKEGEFSKELELALQLIQELETPSDGGTNAMNPMNPKLFSLDAEKGALSGERTGSDRTLNAVSIEEFSAPTAMTTTRYDTVV